MSGEHTFATLSTEDQHHFVRFALEGAQATWSLDVNPILQTQFWENNIREARERGDSIDARLSLLINSTDEEYAASQETEFSRAMEAEEKAGITDEAATLRRISNSTTAWVNSGSVPVKIRHFLRSISSLALAESNELFESLRNAPTSEEIDVHSRVAAIAGLKAEYAEVQLEVANIQLRMLEDGAKIAMLHQALNELAGAELVTAVAEAMQADQKAEEAGDYDEDEESADDTEFALRA